MTEGAIHSTTSDINFSFKKLKEVKEIKTSVDYQKKLNRLVLSSDFKALEKLIDGWIEQFRNNLIFNYETDTVEGYGFRCMAAQLLIDYLTRIKNLRERALKLKNEE